MKPKIRYKLSPEHEKVLDEYVNEKITSREAGQRLGLSHAGAIQFIHKVIFDRFKDGELVYKNKLNNHDQ